MIWTIGRKIAASFAIALSILLIVGSVAYYSTIQFIESSRLVEHTHIVISRVREILSILTEAEGAQRGYTISGDDSFLEPYEGAQQKVNGLLAELRTLTSDNPEQQRNLATLEPVITRKFDHIEAVITSRVKDVSSAQNLVASGKGKELMDEIRRLLGTIEGNEHELLRVRSDQEKQLASTTELVIVLGGLIGAVLLTIVGIALTRNIATPLRQVSEAAQQIASGDLSVRLPLANRTDEVGTLIRSFGRMATWLAEMARASERIAEGNLIAEIRPASEKDILGSAFARMREGLRRNTTDMQEAANVLAASASEILAATSQVAAGISETATAVAETTTTIEEVKQTALVSSQKARLVSESTQQTAQVAKSGRRAVEDSIAEMQRIQGHMELIADTVVKLSEQSQAIGEIVGVVSDLAEQSNLLAVNAAIEAARAGEQGRGFAVVAQEVKSLADQSKQATGQVRTILNDIQKAIAGAVMATEQGSKTVEAGVKQAEDAGDSIRMLTETIETGAQSALQIAASSQQQSIGMDQIASAMENIKQASTQNVAGTRQTEQAARNLNDIGQRLKTLIGQYKT